MFLPNSKLPLCYKILKIEYIYIYILYNYIIIYKNKMLKKKNTSPGSSPKKNPLFCNPVFVPFNDPLFRTGSVKKATGLGAQVSRFRLRGAQQHGVVRVFALRSRFGISQIEEKMVGSACGRDFCLCVFFCLARLASE